MENNLALLAPDTTKCSFDVLSCCRVVVFCNYPTVQAVSPFCWVKSFLYLCGSMQEMSLFDRLFSLPWWWLLLWCIALVDVGFVLGWLAKCLQLNRRHRR